jgi:ABC-type transport system involved in multi-copper enzyme maturation permease subunit
MSVATAETPPATPTVHVGRVTQRRVALSEWTKLRSVRSTRWALLVTLLFIIGIGLIACVVFESRWPHLSAHDRSHFRPLRANLAGVNLAQLAIGVLGVLVITAEYSTGMIRSTFSAVPKRLPILWGKAMVFGTVVFVVSLPAVFIVFFIGQAILSGQHINIAISHPGVVRALFGAPLFLTVMGLFGLGLGAIVRNTAGGIAALAGIVFVLPPLLGILPASFTNSVDPYLPSNAGGAIWTINPDPGTLAPWAGLAVFAAYAVVAIAIAAVLMVRRDT